MEEEFTRMEYSLDAAIQGCEKYMNKFPEKLITVVSNNNDNM